MSRTTAAFTPGRKALILYLTVGYPQLDSALELVPRLEEWGADMVELGIPFSDPMADGTTIQETSFRALELGTTPEMCLEVARKLHQRVSLPMVFMTYYNPVLHFGLDAFCRASVEAGIDGFIIPDLPPQEGTELEGFAGKHDLDLVYLLAPNSGRDRIRLVAAHSRGFIYLVSIIGVTGVRQALPTELEDFASGVRQEASIPLAIGFGISGPEQARRAAAVADGVIVGSRLMQLLGEDRPSPQVKDFVQGLRHALDSF